jgi:putative SOS response-associated peptidase YedK
MCGRFVIDLSPDRVATFFGLAATPDLPPRYNIAPTQPVPVIRQSPDGRRQLSLLRWGLVPAWSREAGAGQINARAETVNEKPSFRQAFRQRRCIIPAGGFYEWQKRDTGKVPHYVCMADGEPMPFAGIWEAWRAPHGQVLESCAILTTSANSAVAPIHERMPVILPTGAFALWLDPQLHDTERLTPLLTPLPADRIVAFEVSPLVNNPVHDGPECIAPGHVTEIGKESKL